MFSGKSSVIEVASITVPAERQRKEFKGLEELAESIKTIGLINPLIVTPDLVLVAGERRLRAHILAGLTHVEVRFTTQLPEAELHRIELEENAKRLDLTWQEDCLAIHRYHALCLELEEEWSTEKTAEALSVSATVVYWKMAIAAYLISGEPLIVNADTYTVARNAVVRLRQRAEDVVNSSIDSMFDEDEPIGGGAAALPFERTEEGYTIIVDEADEMPDVELPAEKKAPSQKVTAAPKAPEGPTILCANFHDFAKTYVGPRFNFLHCDFPYGINVEKHNQGHARKLSPYTDSKDVYFDLLETLVEATPSIVAPTAHMMFWLSPKFLFETVEILTDAGWSVQSYPLIWHRSCNSGIIPDTKRSGRQVYEMALHCTRGDRFIAQSVSNLFSAKKTAEIHGSEKPREMLAHFFRMFVDSSTVMLDPTCGSGNSVNVASKMGAKATLGVELNKEYAERAAALIKKTAHETY